jgi:transaldolase/glucose-6-phosphate isomerase
VKNPLVALRDHGQSVWLDFMSRGLLLRGELQRLISEDGLSGVTSNPSIFEKALDRYGDYAAPLEALAADPGLSPRQLYYRLAVDEVRAAADLLRPIYDQTEGRDGFANLEVSPDLADDTGGTLAEARALWSALGRPNVMVKVPGTAAGVPAIRTLIAEGINVNVTLLFSREVYRQVAQAYLDGLEARLGRGQPIDRVASVASFFVSRIDAAVDELLGQELATATPEQKPVLEALAGKAAIANAKLAYHLYEDLFTAARFADLAAAGARPQRLLWASTGTKNPRYRDVMYVEELIGPDTIDTMPPQTLSAFRQHGCVADTLQSGLEGAEETLATLEKAGVSLAAVTTALVDEGVQKFLQAFVSTLRLLEGKATAYRRRADATSGLGPTA